MFRALVVKEWKQLRMMRWVSVGLALLVPFFLVAGAEGAQQGWLPFDNLSTYSMHTLMMEALPAFLIGLWGLLALLFTAQAYTGDRADGTEEFLLARPVPRRRIWQAARPLTGT